MIDPEHDLSIQKQAEVLDIPPSQAATSVNTCRLLKNDTSMFPVQVRA
jgi:hypothetical protein